MESAVEKEAAPEESSPGRRESAVAFQLPEDEAKEPPAQARPPDPPQAPGPPARPGARQRKSKSVEGAALDEASRRSPGIAEPDPTTEQPAARKTRRLRTPEAAARSKSADKPAKEKPGSSLTAPSLAGRSRTVSPSRLQVEDAAEELRDNGDTPELVPRKPARRKTTFELPQEVQPQEDAEAEELPLASRGTRRIRTSSPSTSREDQPAQHAGQSQDAPVFRKNRRLRTLSPATRSSDKDAADGSEETPVADGAEDAKSKPVRTNRKTQRLATFAASVRNVDEGPAMSQESPPPRSSKTSGMRSLAEAARKAVAAVDAEEREKREQRLTVKEAVDRPKSARLRQSVKSAVDFASIANAARKARRRTTVVRKETAPAEEEEEQQERPPPTPRDLDLIRMTFSSARRGLAMAREAMSLQIVSPFFLLRTVIKSLGKAALIIKEKRRAKGWKILRVFMAAKKRQDFMKLQGEYNSRVQMDDIMEEHVSNIFWQFVVFEVDSYEDILHELVKAFAEPRTGVKQDLPDLRQVLQRHLDHLESELQDRILAGDRESIETAGKRRAMMAKCLERIMEEAATLRSLVVYSRQMSRVGRSEKNTALADAGVLNEIKKLQGAKRLQSRLRRQERERQRQEESGEPRPRRRRRRAAADGVESPSRGSKGRRRKLTSDLAGGEEEEAENSSSSDSSYSSSDYSDSEDEESDDLTDDESVEANSLSSAQEGAGQAEDSTQDEEPDGLDFCRPESVLTPATLGGSTECPDDALRATPLDTGVTPPLLTLPEEQADSDLPEAIEDNRSITITGSLGGSITLGRQWSRISSKSSMTSPSASHSGRFLFQETDPDLEAKMVVHSSAEWQSMIASFMVGRSPEEFVALDRHQMVIPLFQEDWTQLSAPTLAFPITIQHKEAPLVVEYNAQWVQVVGSYMRGRDPGDYDVIDSHEQIVPLFEEGWTASSPLPSFPLRIQRKESLPGSGRTSPRGASKNRMMPGRRRRYGNAVFRWEEVEGLMDETDTPESGSPTRTTTKDAGDAEAAQASEDLLDEGSDSRVEPAFNESFAWLEDSVLPQKVKMHLEKCRGPPLGEVPSRMPFLFRRGRLRATAAYCSPRQDQGELQEAESALGSVKRVRRAHEHRLSLDEVRELREHDVESDRILHSWRENKAAAPIPPLGLKPVLGRSKVPWENSPHLANMPFGHIAKPRFGRFPPDLENRSQATPPSTAGSTRRRLQGTQMIGKTRSRPWEVKDEQRKIFPLVSFHRSLCKVQA